MPTLAILALLAGQTGAATAFPPIVKKELFARNDLRGKPAPKMQFGTWLHKPSPNMKGKVVLVDFWATWCGPCRALIPTLNEWQKRFGDDLVIVGLSDERPDVVKRFMADTAKNYSVATDPSGAMKKALGVRGIPHVMIVSQDGIVRWQGYPGDRSDPLTDVKLAQIIVASKRLK